MIFKPFNNDQINKYTAYIMAFYIVYLLLAIPIIVFPLMNGFEISIVSPFHLAMSILWIMAISFVFEFVCCRAWPSNSGYELTLYVYHRSLKIMLVLNIAIILFGLLILAGSQNMSYFYAFCFLFYIGLCLVTWHFRFELSKQIQEACKKDQGSEEGDS